jgi:hypothetical protein
VTTPLVEIRPICFPANHRAASGPLVIATGLPGMLGNSVMVGVDCAKAQDIVSAKLKSSTKLKSIDQRERVASMAG